LCSNLHFGLNGVSIVGWARCANREIWLFTALSEHRNPRNGGRTSMVGFGAR